MAELLKKPAAPKTKAKAVAAAPVTAKPEPHRYRVSVPVADEAVAAWMELQDDRSLSVRMLIRESIARLGYVDVVNRPVDQLPKRGRPAGQGEEEGNGTADAGSFPGPEQPTGEVRAMRREYVRKTGVEAEGFRAARDRGSASTPAPLTGDLDLSPAEDAEPELRGIALTTPTLKQEPDRQESEAVTVPPTPEPEQSSGGQMDVEDIFKTLR